MMNETTFYRNRPDFLFFDERQRKEKRRPVKGGIFIALKSWKTQNYAVSFAKIPGESK